VSEKQTPKCPGCGAERVKKYRPFCSKRCADMDLGRWFIGAYAVPSEELPDEFDIGMDDQPPPGETDDGY
tara:strand:- start:586 stop:795 length:210 start_codon:yes stop_codon:yes gene_type:complete